MLTNFKQDLAQGKRGEQIVGQVFSKLDTTRDYYYVGDNPEYYHKGDIMAVDQDNHQIMIEVKNDTVIHKTGNVLCEEKVFYKDSEIEKKGFMYNDYEIFCVVSEPARRIYVIDFKVLKKIYQYYTPKFFDYVSQSSDTYLVPLAAIKKSGGLIDVIDY